MFESNYLKYQEILSGNCKDINDIMNSYSLYDDLKKEANYIYDKIENKEAWIKSEILSLIDKNVLIPLNFNNEFKKIYLTSFLKFDLINDYLKDENLIFDITSELSIVFNKYLENKKLYEVLHILFIMVTNSINSTKTFEFIEKLLIIYTKSDFEDKTLIYGIIDFVENKYSFDKMGYIKKNFPSILLS